ncbi:MAG: purine-binding chemotaxis protein CheW [Campylobacterota bacterium]|nr:purine-binding chemotaxis protein CheW [Campylobacterota bacterium]
MKEKEKIKEGHKNRFLTFYLEGELYGMDIASVQEIIAMMKTTPVPKTPKCVEGVMNLRGNIIPIVSLRTMFDMPKKPHEAYTAIIIVKHEGISIGYIVDRVEEVVNIADEQLSEPPRFDSSVKASFLQKMAQFEKGVIMILNLQSIFSNEEIADLEVISK